MHNRCYQLMGQVNLSFVIEGYIKQSVERQYICQNCNKGASSEVRARLEETLGVRAVFWRWEWWGSVTPPRLAGELGRGRTLKWGWGERGGEKREKACREMQPTYCLSSTSFNRLDPTQSPK